MTFILFSGQLLNFETDFQSNTPSNSARKNSSKYLSKSLVLYSFIIINDIKYKYGKIYSSVPQKVTSFFGAQNAPILKPYISRTKFRRYSIYCLKRIPVKYSSDWAIGSRDSLYGSKVDAADKLSWLSINEFYSGIELSPDNIE